MTCSCIKFPVHDHPYSQRRSVSLFRYLLPIHSHQKMDEKLDGIYNLLAQWNAGSEPSSLLRPFSPSPPPPHPTTLTADELVFLKKQEVAGKISLQHETLPPPHQSTHDPSSNHAYTTTDPTLTLQHGFTFIQNPSETQNQPKTSPHNRQTTNPQQVSIPETTRQHPQLDIQPHFNLSIARPKLDFPTLMGEEPYNWLRKCDKYFSLANVPMETWVPLATLHYSGLTQTWWRSLRTPATYLHWTQFYTMVSNRFNSHSARSSLENFHHVKQTTSVIEYI
jgi:hypothetical protein